MVDDIRPPVRNNPDDEKNKNFEPLEMKQPPVEVVQEAMPDIAKQEDGFVVIPEKGKRKPKNPFNILIQKLGNMSKKKKLILALIVIIILGSSGAGAYALLNKQEPAPVVQPKPVVSEKKIEEPPKPTTEASKISGLQVSPEINKRPVVSIQIENSPDARPQSGLHQASVVFEAIAEGGITRFNASFLDNQPEYIGPIRSVRPYYAQMVAPFDPIFVHAGGSGDGLAKLAELGLKDLDHGPNASAFQRTSDRYAPHNLYSSMSALDSVSKSRGYTTSETKSLTRKEEKPSPSPTARTINMSISSPLYNTSYAYDKDNNSYKRSLAGAPHLDEKSGTQIAPKVLVAMVTPFSQNGIYSVYGVIGTGKAFIFQDGNVSEVTWTKAADKEQVKFTDAAGKEVGLNPGQTWFTLLKDPSNVTYSP